MFSLSPRVSVLKSTLRKKLLVSTVDNYYLLTGLRCHMNDACVSNPCHKDAVCDTSPIDGTYKCICNPGWTGADCDVDINECLQGDN